MDVALTKDTLTTKITKATKKGGFETRPYFFVLCVLCGYIASFFVLFGSFVVKFALRPLRCLRLKDPTDPYRP